jgi:A/G-specific adenine glycosylase
MAADSAVSAAGQSQVSTPDLLRLLRPWWQLNARDLPWREPGTSPWGILVSEVMSQQTPMIRVVPYWTTWMRAWPTPAALAQASSAEVITAWGKLGYPRRALRLQECARVVSKRYGGTLPTDYEALLSLPGVGEYTASAVASFAYGQRVAVVDTNIRRVLSRAIGGEESYGGATTAADRAKALEVLPANAADAQLWNQAIMELGATVCTSSSPQCEVCPFADVCKWRAAGYPGMGSKPTRKRQKWKGTNRQVRGIILDALRQKAAAGAVPAELTPQELSALWPNQAQLSECVAGLDDDRLVEILPDGGLAFPQ